MTFLNSLFGPGSGSSKTTMVAPEDALPGRSAPLLQAPQPHTVLGSSITGPWEPGTRVLYLAMGCFWGAEEIYWQVPGVVSTAVGYMGGTTPNPTYEEVCTARTGHTETALVAYDPTKVSEAELLKIFWERHDPTQGFRQGNDVGTQYRSAIYWTTPEQAEAAQETAERYAEVLSAKGYDAITTEIAPAAEAGPFYYAEDYHQQYLSDAKNPNGYRCHATTGVPFPDAA
jgi:peptide-methionine (S)-S-oxide reductase